MIIYSVTVSVDHEVAQGWLSWMKDIHIPEVMASGYFSSYRICILREPIHDTESITYNIQYECDDLETYTQYRDQEAPRLQAAHTERFGDHFVAFRTLLETV